MPILHCPPANPRVDFTLCVIPGVSRGPRSLLHSHCPDAKYIVWGERLEGAGARPWVTALGEAGQEAAGFSGLARSIPAPTLTKRPLQPGVPCPFSRGQIRGWVYSQPSPTAACPSRRERPLQRGALSSGRCPPGGGRRSVPAISAVRAPAQPFPRSGAGTAPPGSAPPPLHDSPAAPGLRPPHLRAGAAAGSPQRRAGSSAAPPAARGGNSPPCGPGAARG